MVLLIPALSVQKKPHRKDQIAIPEDKHDSSSLLAPLWRTDELSEYQQESQLSLAKVSILHVAIYNMQISMSSYDTVLVHRFSPYVNDLHLVKLSNQH